MSFMTSLATVMMLLPSVIYAHFTVQHPPAVGPFNDDAEGDAPCGGYSPDISKVSITDFHVDGDFISTTLTHPEGNWLYRINTDPNARGNWTQVYPIFQQSGGGTYCSPQVSIPHEFIGKNAFLGIVSHAIDGFLYQCSGVHFVQGTATPPGDCKNASGIETAYVSDDQLLSQLNVSSASTPERVPNDGVPSKGQAFQALCGAFTIGTMVVLGAVLAV